MSALDEFISTLQGLKTFASEAASEAAPLIESANKKTAAAGTTPDGKPWPEKKTGGRPFVHAADKVTATALGSVVQIRLDGPEIFGQYGAGQPKRVVIPERGGVLPKDIAEAAKAGAKKAFEKMTGGR